MTLEQDMINGNGHVEIHSRRENRKRRRVFSKTVQLSFVFQTGRTRSFGRKWFWVMSRFRTWLSNPGRPKTAAGRDFWGEFSNG